MKILYEGIPGETEQRCVKCNSVFAFTKEDEDILEDHMELQSTIEIDHAHKVNCPVCGVIIVTDIHYKERDLNKE